MCGSLNHVSFKIIDYYCVYGYVCCEYVHIFSENISMLSSVTLKITKECFIKLRLMKSSQEFFKSNLEVIQVAFT